MPPVSNSCAVNSDVLVYILYCTDNKGLERYVRKTVRASIGALSQGNLEKRLKKCFDLPHSQSIRLLRKSKKLKKYVDLETDADYRVLARSAGLKRCVLLVMIDELLYDYYKSRTSVFDEFFSSKGASSRKGASSLSSPSSSVSTLESTDQHKGCDISSSFEVPSTADTNQDSINECLVEHSPQNISNNSASDATKEYINTTCTKLLTDLEERLSNQIKDAINSVAEKSFTNEERKCNPEPKLDTEPKSTTVHRGFSCNSCYPVNARNNYPIKGVRYKCLDCYDFDLCDKCERNGVSVENHNSLHTMVKIIKPSACTKHPELMKKESSKQKRSTKLHYGIFCDSCHPEGKSFSTPIKGCRYKCLQCEDFDLCEDCEARGFTNNIHKSDHIMAKVSTPVNARFSLSNFIKSADEEPPNFPNIYCDFCCEEGKPNSIVAKGVCYCCTICADFHMCETCHTQNKENLSHKSFHGMKAMLPANLVDNEPIFLAALSDAVKSKAMSLNEETCAKCEARCVESVRYDCAICDNFTLCHECYSIGAEKYDHRSFHKMIAIIDNEFYQAKKTDYITTFDKNAEFARLASNHGIFSQTALFSLIARSSFFSELCSLMSDGTTDGFSDENSFEKMKVILNEYKSEKQNIMGVDDKVIEELSTTVETLDISLNGENNEEGLSRKGKEPFVEETQHEEDETRTIKYLEYDTDTIGTEEGETRKLANLESNTDIFVKKEPVSENSDVNEVNDVSITSLTTPDYEESSSATIDISMPLKSSSMLILPKIGKQDSSILLEQDSALDSGSQENRSSNGDDVVSSWSCESGGETSEFEILDSDIGF